MITKVRDDQYLNIFEEIWLFLAAEFIMSAGFMKLYDIEADEWHFRRLFWYAVGVAVTVPVLVCCIVGTVAAIKYLW